MLAMWQDEEGVDFWRFYAPNRASPVMISPDRQQDFEMFLEQQNIPYTVKINDLEVMLEEERQSMARNRRAKATVMPGMVPDFSVFWSSAEMETYCTFLANQYPSLVTMETLVWSPGGRRIYAMRISNGNFGDKPIIAMESGMHAR